MKAAALANGFWHMGDFSRLYKATFGEVPTQTTARAARPNAGNSLPEDAFAVPSAPSAAFASAWPMLQQHN